MIIFMIYLAGVMVVHGAHIVEKENIGWCKVTIHLLLSWITVGLIIGCMSNDLEEIKNILLKVKDEAFTKVN